MSAPIASNFAFSPSMMDNTFSQWATYGLSMFKDLYIDDVFASFQQLVDKFSLPRNNFFRYLQARSFIRNMYPQFPRLPTPTSIDLFLEPLPFGKRMISFFYDKICSLHRSSLLTIKTQWEEDLLEEISDELWESILYRVHSSSVCVEHGWIQCKILHRTHWSKVKLSKIYSDIDPICDCCRQAPATLAHMFWFCPTLHGYWTDIFETMSEVVETIIEPVAITALFGALSLPVHCPRYKADFVAFVTLLARCQILLHWKSSVPPTHS